MVIIVTALVVVFVASALTFTRAAVSESERERRELQALYAAEGGVNAALLRIAESYQTGNAVTPNIGSEAAPDGARVGQFWATIEDNGDDTLTILSTGAAGLARRSIEAIVQSLPPNPMEHAMFAGNFSEDSAYQLELGGTGTQADDVTGNVYSGGDVVINGDASVNGDLTTGGEIYGGSGRTGVTMDYPQLLEVDFETFHDYDVASLFADATPQSDDCGGTADQLPVESPVHFLRRNPDDRTSDVDSTEKDDYFIEDPYETVRNDRDQDGSDAYEVSIPAEANESVFFIDGNLWLHNRKVFSFKFENDGPNPTQVTFVVKGNVYFSDNLFYGDPALDGIAFIALADPEVEDSGNIYFGDPVFGTMQYAESLFFAEDTFYDNNLDEAGSTEVRLRGNMTAGNHVAINRDHANNDGSTSHTRLELTFDDRQANGSLSLPGIPMAEDHPVGYSIAAWREVPVPRTHTPAAVDVKVDTPNMGFGGASGAWRDRWDTKYGTQWREDNRPWGRWRR